MRMIDEAGGRFYDAEDKLSQIVQVREKAESGLKMSLTDKHVREEVQIEEQNRSEFEAFTAMWDQKFMVYQREAVSQMEKLRQRHAVQLQQLR